MKTKAWIGRFDWARAAAVLAVAAVLAAPIGCGDDGGAGAVSEMSEDQLAIYSLIESVPDMTTSLPRLRESFTKENAPKASDVKKYSQNMFQPASPITVTGDTASFTVNIAPITNSRQGVEKNWKATKVDGDWKLSETPLP